MIARLKRLQLVVKLQGLDKTRNRISAKTLIPMIFYQMTCNHFITMKASKFGYSTCFSFRSIRFDRYLASWILLTVFMADTLIHFYGRFETFLNSFDEILVSLKPNFYFDRLRFDFMQTKIF